ncbi:hypothetical protein GmHk_15G044739 [Glycine max]|nr:hypothetical protein GmHk_15G044739 [Glycine max]
MLAESDHYRVEFRACKDDAWYTARVSLEGETLTVKYLNLPDEYDNAFRASEFGERFRPLSKQIFIWFLFSSFIWFVVSCHDMEDRVLEVTKTNVCMILIANIDRVLCPSAITEILHRHTSVSASVFIFLNLSLEVYTWGAIVLDSEKEFQELCDFLNNPNCIVTSSTGRPWVILEKPVGLKNIKASIGRLVHVTKNILQKGKSGTSNNLKVVHSRTQEFKIASDMRDLFLEFFNHQERLHKRLALEERRIMGVCVFFNKVREKVTKKESAFTRVI